MMARISEPTSPVQNAAGMVTTGDRPVSSSSAPRLMPNAPIHSAAARPTRRISRWPVRPMTSIPAANAVKCRLLTV